MRSTNVLKISREMILLKKIGVYILISVLILGLAGCSRHVETADIRENPDEAIIQITDDDGKLIEMEKPAERIISLYSAHTENLFSLGLEEQIIGVGKVTIIRSK